MPTEKIYCPLCQTNETKFIHKGERASAFRPFYNCHRCGLTFTPELHYPSNEEEKARYLTHNNDPNDQGYVNFLNRLGSEIIKTAPLGSYGLDYGSGPNPVLANLLEKAGFKMAIYDPFFANETAPLQESYDFITCCETAEHFFQPNKEFNKLDKLLKPGGILAIMTEMLSKIEDFAAWRYHNDTTHVIFFTRKTMEWIADKKGWECQFPSRNVTLFFKPGLTDHA